jgi:hypothetical protein
MQIKKNLPFRKCKWREIQILYHDTHLFLHVFTINETQVFYVASMKTSFKYIPRQTHDGQNAYWRTT